MLPRPKHKKGFTLGHYLDEWWDKMGQEFKAKLFISVWVVLVSSAGVGLFAWYKVYEKGELLEAAKIHQAREKEIARGKLMQRPVSPGTWSPRED